MRRYFFIMFLILIGVEISSQNVGIGTNTPDPSAILDITSGNKGMLIPGIALTAENDATTIVTPAIGLLVYNTLTVNGLSPGYYHNAGTTAVPVWKRLISDAANGSETNTTAGSNIILTGTGTVASPYVVANTSGTQPGQMQYWNGTAWVPVAPASYSGQRLYFVNNKPQWGPLVGPTDVMNPTTGKVWMDRNLGATQVATSSIDGNAYGYSYQWGRGTDGHQIRTSGTNGTLSTSDNPGHGNFILAPSSPYDWRNPQNDNLWQGASGINNPCPSGYRLPTAPELDEDRLSWTSNNAAGAFASPLKLPRAGARNYSSGLFAAVGENGYYWSSTVSGTDAAYLSFFTTGAGLSSSKRASGQSVRCLKDATLPGTIGVLNCSGAVTSGNLIIGVPASGVSSSIPYTGGNGGYHSGQEVISTGVTGLTANLDAGLFLNGAGNLMYSITGTPGSSGTASFALSIGGQTCTMNRTVTTGTISSLDCGGATNTGTLIAGVAASEVSSSVPFTGGNGGTHSGQTVTSTGVTGLTATLVSGNFVNGSGNLTYTISGTPSSHGTASFALNIGGQMCTLNRTVNPGEIGNLDCGGATNTGTLIAGVAASGVSSSVPYTGGNGGTHSGQTVTSIGVTGLTATLTAGAFANVSGNLTYTISGTPASNGTASFAIDIGGQTCTLNRTVSPGAISNLDCGGATNTGTLIAGVEASGVSSSVPYAGGNGGAHSGQTVTSTGETGLTATLASGNFVNGSGNLTYTISGTPASSGTASFAIDIGGRTCTLNRTVIPGAISGLDCGSTTNTGTLIAGVAASGISSSVPYTGGNGGTHSGQTVTSTGVTGLTATLASGTFANGNGNLTYTITGTPSAAGIASFALNIGGQMCNLNLTVNHSVPNCNTSNPTLIVDVTNPATGKIWMDRNLGANRVATSSTDAESYGSLFQWGRGADGHQCVHRYTDDGVTTSGTTGTISSTDTPGHSNFILSGNFPYDWRSPKKDNLWQGVSGINNPCPSGYRVPTYVEFDSEKLSWSSNNAAGAFASPLKLPLAGARSIDDGGSFYDVGTSGRYWSSTVSGTNAGYIYFGSNNALLVTSVRASGHSVRCLKN